MLAQICLTKRETEVMKAVAEGFSSQEVAEQLMCCKRTIDFHLANAYEKLGAKNRMQAVNRAQKLGLI